MTISINQISNGTALLINTDIFLVTEYHHVKPGKGSAFVRVKLKNIKTQQVLERTFKSSEKLEDIPLEERKMQVLYRGGDGYHFMDLTTYEEVVIPFDMLGDTINFLQEQLEVSGTFFENQCQKVNLPIFINALIAQADPGLRGDSSKAGTKPAVIETGATIQVPLFINTDDRVKIDTRTGTYVERVKS